MVFTITTSALVRNRACSRKIALIRTHKTVHLAALVKGGRMGFASRILRRTPAIGVCSIGGPVARLTRLARHGLQDGDAFRFPT